MCSAKAVVLLSLSRLQFGNQAVMLEAGLSVSGKLGFGLVSSLLIYIILIPHLLEAVGILRPEGFGWK